MGHSYLCCLTYKVAQPYRSVEMRLTPFYLMGVLLSAGALQACPSSGVYRSAKPLQQGQSEFGLGLNITRVAREGVNNAEDAEMANVLVETAKTLPKVVPEVTYHRGVTEDVDLGGRVDVTGGLVEVDVKYRFLDGDSANFALQPAIGYQTTLLVDGFRVTLPILATFDLSKRFGVNTYGMVQFADQLPTEEKRDGAAKIQGFTLGGGVGVILSADRFFVSPNIEVVRTLSRATTEKAKYTLMIANINFGFLFGHKEP